ncbi:polysaccharide biosynthesis tyrosine autokinase [Candidatus Saccharibacteria bacterium]|nr:polysaccharide biosynthesis tyrosine autokinase [Candidatus Saccharibacteria bacterium]
MDEINIKDFFNYLKHYILAFIILAIVAVGGTIIYDTVIKQPIYQAQTTVVVANADGTNLENSSAATLNDINASQKLVTTYSEIAKSELVLNRVVENLGLQLNAKQLSKNLSVKVIDNTSILSISVKDPIPRVASATANEVAKVFTEEVKSIYKVDNVTQLSVAETPESPANNTLTRDIILSFAIAIILVAGFAFLKFYLDDTIRYNDDVEKAIGFPITGRITRGEIKNKKPGNELIAEKTPKAIVSENIKSLRTNLQFTAIDKDLKTILVTSVNASEGKSFVAANLAISFAQADKNVLLVDCDLRKGRSHKMFGLSNTSGLSNLLAGSLRNVREYIRPTKIKNLDIVTCGTYPPNPSELLASQKNKRLVQVLSEHYDIVIFDGAPIGGLADSVILSSLMDETIIIVKDGNTSKKDLALAKDSLDKVGARVAGVVFNMVNHKSSKYYNNYYHYGDKE